MDKMKRIEHLEKVIDKLHSELKTGNHVGSGINVNLTVGMSAENNMSIYCPVTNLTQELLELILKDQQVLLKQTILMLEIERSQIDNFLKERQIS